VCKCALPSYTCISDIFFKFSAGYRLCDHVISEHNTLNFLECSLYCLRKPFDCKSINYKARKHQHPSKNCQLNNATKTAHPQNLLPDKNYDYYEPLVVQKVLLDDFLYKHGKQSFKQAIIFFMKY
jgi:hypothetical protein